MFHRNQLRVISVCTCVHTHIHFSPIIPAGLLYRNHVINSFLLSAPLLQDLLFNKSNCFDVVLMDQTVRIFCFDCICLISLSSHWYKFYEAGWTLLDRGSVRYRNHLDICQNYHSPQTTYFFHHLCSFFGVFLSGSFGLAISNNTLFC